MYRIVPAVVAIALALVLQAAVAPYISIGGVVPNFFLLVVVTLALTTGPIEGAAAGLVGGLLFDLLGTGAVGPMCLVLTVAGYVAGLLHEQMFAEGWLLPLTVLGIVALVTEVSYGLILVVLGELSAFWVALFARMLPAAVYNTALALLVYPWLARFLRTDRPMRTFKRLA